MDRRMNIKQDSYWHSCHQGGSEHRAVSFTSFLYLSGLKGTEKQKLLKALITLDSNND